MGPGRAALAGGQGMPQEGTLPRFSAPEGGEAENPVGERDGRSWAGGRVSHGDLIFSMNHRGPSLFAPTPPSGCTEGKQREQAGAPTPQR